MSLLCFEFDDCTFKFVPIVTTIGVTMAAKTRSSSARPTYGELIDIFNEVQRSSHNDENCLLSEFRKYYPKCPIGRPRRFFETVQRIAAPTQPSLISQPKLSGSPLQSYRKRVWQPRVRNPAGSAPAGKYHNGIVSLGRSTCSMHFSLGGLLLCRHVKLFYHSH